MAKGILRQGILRIDADIPAEWWCLGLSRDNAKDILQLPASYTVEEIGMDSTGTHVCLTVSSSDIPSVAEGQPLPEIAATFSKTQEEQGQWDQPQSYQLTRLLATYTIDLPLTSKEAN